MTATFQSKPLFVSHGSPMLAVETGRVPDMLRELGRSFAGVQALVVVSAHWETRIPAVSLATQPETIHDFGGFPAELYRLQYPAKGAPDAARRVLELLSGAGISAAASPDRGLDHGAWVPLMHMVPEASLPVSQLSVVHRGSAEEHYRIGQALQPLRDEGIALLASGSLTHNLRDIDWSSPQGGSVATAAEFADWFAARAAAGDVEALLDYRRRAPHAVRNHPTDEHLMPFYVAFGANGGEPLARHAGGYVYGSISMDAFAAAA